MRMLGCLAVFVVSSGVTESVEAQVLTGRIVDAEDRRGIQHAFVEVLAATDQRVGGGFTELDGRFRIEIPATDGLLVVAVGALGYDSGSWDVPQVLTNGVVNLGDLDLRTNPIALLPLRAQVRRSGLTSGQEWVRRRQLLERGIFFSGAVLAADAPRSLSEYLAEQTGFRVSRDYRGTLSLFNPEANCTLAFVNEWPMNVSVRPPRMTVGLALSDRQSIAATFDDEHMGFSSLDEIPSTWIAAVEVYADSRDVPAGPLQFTSSGGHGCAVVNVWTWNSW